MKTKSVVVDDFVNYKKPSLFISTCYCDWKCCKDQKMDISMCQNSPLNKSQIKEFSNSELLSLYKNSIFQKSVVFGGLEPFEQFDDILSFIKFFRNVCNDDIVIYTGYYKNEIEDKLSKLKKYKNIIIKFGRFIPNDESHFDEVLGVKLASKNQYAERIS